MTSNDVWLEQVAFSADQVRKAEAAMMKDVAPSTLMARAVFGCSVQVRRSLKSRGISITDARVVSLVGRGNNGGDALFVSADCAKRGAWVDAFLAGGTADVHKEALLAAMNAGVKIHETESVTGKADPTRTNLATLIDKADVALDGLLGIGSVGPLRKEFRPLVKAFNDSPALRLAVDVPTGIDPTTGEINETGLAVEADLTVTFGAFKTGLLTGPGVEHAGEVHLVDIGLGDYLPKPPVRIVSQNQALEISREPVRSSDKYSRGVVGVIAGSKNYPGAALLAVGAARRSGVGMVRYVGPCAAEVIKEYPDVVATNSLANAGRAQVWLVGPGLGQDKEAKKLLKESLALATPLVIDADGLNLLAAHTSPKDLKHRLKQGFVTLLTPHAGEATRLLEAVGERDLLDEGRIATAKGLADSWRSVTLLKGPGTVVAAPNSNQVWIDRLGDQSLATAGSGDVLSGLLAGVMAHRLAGTSPSSDDDIDWAKLSAQAVAWHALSGKRAASTSQNFVTSADLLGHLGGSTVRNGTPRVQIDSQAIMHNVDVLVQSAGNAEVMAVVKANAYGHGLVGVSKLARAAGASWLGVAQLDEALQLRAAGDAGPLLAWLAVPEDDFVSCVTQDVDLGLSASWALSKAAEAARLVGTPAKVHLKIDTGLGRAGATRADWESLVAMALGFEAEGTMKIVGIWSHFALADAPGDKTIEKQLEVFSQACEVAKSMGVRNAIRHIANSAATLSLPKAHFDLVRPGIAIYGISPGAQVGRAEDFGLVPAMRVSTSLSMVKRVSAGTGLSYGHEYKTKRDANVAIVPMGYADGVPRNATNRGPVWCAGARRTVSGRVCMDQFVVDIGDAPAQAGDEAVLFGSGAAGEPTAEDWASATGTIAYEIVTRISPRSGREFL